MTATAAPPAAAARRTPPRPAWREPAFVLLFVGGIFVDMINGNAKLIGFPISPDRLFFGGALVLVLTDPVARREVRLRWRVVHTLMLLLLLWVAFSGFSAGTITSTYGLYAFIDRLFVPFAAFTLAPVIFSTPARRDLILKALTVMGIYLGLTAIFEIFGPHALVWPRYIMDPNVGIHFGYARGPFLEAEANGLAIIACGLCAGLLFTRSRGRWRQAAAVCVGLCLLGGLLAQERTVWISEGLAILATGLLVPQLRRKLPAVVAGIAIVIGLALALSPALREHVNSRASDQTSVYDRRNTDAAAIRIIEAKPLTGIGWTEFETEGVNWVRLSPNYPITNVRIEVHNVYLSRAAETGVPGGALFVACLIAGPLRALVRRWRRPGLADAPDALGWHVVFTGVVLGWLVCSMLSPLPYPLPNLEMWLFAGIVLSPWLAPEQPKPVAPSVTADGELVVAPVASESQAA